jgi:phage pi2 protein 07
MTNIQKIYLTEEEASKRYGYSRQWYQRQRWLGTGPKFIKVNGGRVFYPIQDTDNWFSNFGLRASTSATQFIHEK